MDFVQDVVVNICPLFLLDDLQDDLEENDPVVTPSLNVSFFQLLCLFLISDWEVTSLAKLTFVLLAKDFFLSLSCTILSVSCAK